MKKIKKLFAHKIFKIIKWAFLVFVVFSIFMFVTRAIHFFNVDRTNAQIEKIHNTKLTMADVMGKNLPPDPGALANKTVRGVDANHNGIRDDVELAIFKKYPNSAKTRAVLLQYALALQMETTQPFLNAGVAGEIANKEDRAVFCSAKNISIGGEDGVIKAIQKYGKFLFNLQLNTKTRKAKHKDFYSYVKSGRIDETTKCDINLSKLSN